MTKSEWLFMRLNAANEAANGARRDIEMAFSRDHKASLIKATTERDAAIVEATEIRSLLKNEPTKGATNDN